jgi:hypothetical protein
MFKRLRAFCAAAMLSLGLAASITPDAVLAQQSQLPPGEVCFSGTTGVSGMIGVLGTITAGTGGTAGTYVNVPLTGGSGTGATANITVSGGGVTQVVILNPGTTYQVNDTLTAASGNIGGVTGFSVTVNSTAINSALAGGSVGFYVPGTLTTKQTYQDQAGTILNQNPVPLDANGCAIIFGSGAYRQIVYDSLGNEIWDQNTYGLTQNPFWASLAGGTANAITVTDASFSATDGQSIQFVAANSNTGATTITPSGTGSAIPVYKNSPSGPVPLTGVPEIAAGNLVTVTYYAAQNYFLLAGYNQITAAMQPVVTSTTIGAASGALGLSFGQGYLSAPVNGGTTVTFSPFNGNYVKIAGVDYPIPSAGVSAVATNCYINGSSGQTLVANTKYYVYIFNNAGTLTLDFSTTGHVTDSSAGNVGVEIESGNNSRSLIGMVYPQSGPVFNNGGANLLVLSWFNRRSLSGINAFGANQTTTSTAFVELSSTIRVQFLTWAGEDVQINASGSAVGPSNALMASSLGIDGTTPEDVNDTRGTVSGAPQASVAIAYLKSGLSEGYHYATLLGLVSGGTGTWNGSGSPGSRVAMTVGIRG